MIKRTIAFQNYRLVNLFCILYYSSSLINAHLMTPLFPGNRKSIPIFSSVEKLFFLNVTLKVLDFIPVSWLTKNFPMLIFLCFFVLSIAAKTDSKLTLHHMGKNFIIYLNQIKFKIWMVAFLKSVFYNKEIMGLTFGFQEITETSNAYWYEMNCGLV